MRHALLFVLLIAPCLLQAGTLTGRVVHVSGGDSLVVTDVNHAQHRIRLLGIEAPAPGEAYAAASRQHLSSAVAGRFVVVEYEKRDRHERFLGKLLLGNRDMNLEQIKAGLAWHHLQHRDAQSSSDWEKYSDAELEARMNKRGFWADHDPVPPRGPPQAGQESLPSLPSRFDDPEAK